MSSDNDDEVKRVVYEAPKSFAVALVHGLVALVTILVQGAIIVCCCCSYEARDCVKACQPNAVIRCQLHSVECSKPQTCAQDSSKVVQ